MSHGLIQNVYMIFKFWSSRVFYYSNNCTWGRSWVWPTSRCTAVTCTGRPALTAVWPETRTAPGTASPAPDTLPHRRGEHQDSVDRTERVCFSEKSHPCAYVTFYDFNTLKYVDVKFFISVCWSDPFRRSRRQDVKYGNPIRQCRGYNSNGECSDCRQCSDIHLLSTSRELACALYLFYIFYFPTSKTLIYVYMLFDSKQEHPGDGSVRCGGQHHLCGVSGPVSSHVSEVAPAEGKQWQKERGEPRFYCKAALVSLQPNSLNRSGV